MRIKVYLAAISFLLLGNGLKAQETVEPDSICRVNKTYIKSYWTDFKGLAASPAKWSKGEALAAGSIVATGALLYWQDKNITEFFKDNQSDFFDDANKYFFDPFGKMYYTIPLMAGFYIYGSAAKKNKPKAVAMDFVKASLYSGVIVTALKHLTHRHRPYQTDPLNPYLWDGPLTDDMNYTSFPSGHTIMAWTFASVLATHYRDKLWVPITVYSLATMEGLARIYAQKHWSTDVLVGAALGYAIGTYVVKHSNCNFILTPVVSSNYSGLSLSFSFGKPKSVFEKY